MINSNIDKKRFPGTLSLMENLHMDLTQYTKSLMAIAVMASSSAFAEVPHTFSSGTAASASQVNENFQALDGRVTAMPGAVQYDLSDYRADGSMTNKIFSSKQTRRGSDPETPNAIYTVSSCDQMIVSISDPTTKIFVGKNSSTGDPCWEERYLYQTIEGKKLYLGLDSYGVDSFTGQLWKSFSARHQNPIEETSVINPSQAWGNSGVLVSQRFDPTGALLETYDSVEINTYTFMGVEDVTVPAGTFNNCIKLHRDKAVPGRREMRVRWQCPGVGTVKYLRTRVSGSSTVRELISYQ